MPQTSDEVRDLIAYWFKTKEDPDNVESCLAVLRSKGWTEVSGRLHPPSPSYYGPIEDYILLKYLLEEWDYNYTTTNFAERLKRPK